MSSSDTKKDKTVGVRLPRDLFEQVRARAKAESRSVSNYLMLLIVNDLDRREAGEYPVSGNCKLLTEEEAEAVAQLLAASKRLQDVGGTYSVDPGHRNGDGI